MDAFMHRASCVNRFVLHDEEEAFVDVHARHRPTSIRVESFMPKEHHHGWKSVQRSRAGRQEQDRSDTRCDAEYGLEGFGRVDGAVVKVAAVDVAGGLEVKQPT